MFSAVVGCPDGVYAKWAPRLDTKYVHLGFVYFILDIYHKRSRV